jgi:hypothetical protein
VLFVVHMFSTTDTIVAIATPPGRGGIGVVRLSGPHAHDIARRLITHERPLEPRHATLTLVRIKADGNEEVRLKPDTTAGLKSCATMAGLHACTTTERDSPVVQGSSRRPPAAQDFSRRPPAAQD